MRIAPVPPACPKPLKTRPPALWGTPQARKAYHPAAMRLNEQFVDMHLEMRSGKLGLDFTHFDDTVCATGAG
jgi:hypothetical protein